MLDGEYVVRKYQKLYPHQTLQDIEMIKSLSNEQAKNVLALQGKKIVSLLGNEVDRLEFEIKKVRPEVKHVDLEIL